MGNWSVQQDLKKEKREFDKTCKENLAKFFYDLAKLTFAGVVIGGIIPLYGSPYDVIQWTMVISGLVGTGMIAFFANRILKK